jgi:hypothetical protein
MCIVWHNKTAFSQTYILHNIHKITYHQQHERKRGSAETESFLKETLQVVLATAIIHVDRLYFPVNENKIINYNILNQQADLY